MEQSISDLLISIYMHFLRLVTSIYEMEPLNLINICYITGSVKWMFLTGGKINSSPTIGSDRTIYFGSDDFYLYAITPYGSKIFIQNKYIFSMHYFFTYW